MFGSKLKSLNYLLMNKHYFIMQHSRDSIGMLSIITIVKYQIDYARFSFDVQIALILSVGSSFMLLAYSWQSKKIKLLVEKTLKFVLFCGNISIFL